MGGKKSYSPPSPPLLFHCSDEDAKHITIIPDMRPSGAGKTTENGTRVFTCLQNINPKTLPMTITRHIPNSYFFFHLVRVYGDTQHKKEWFFNEWLSAQELKNSHVYIVTNIDISDNKDIQQHFHTSLSREYCNHRVNSSNRLFS